MVSILSLYYNNPENVVKAFMKREEIKRMASRWGDDIDEELKKEKKVLLIFG